MAFFRGKEILWAGLKGDPGPQGLTGARGDQGDSCFIVYSDTDVGKEFSSVRLEGMDWIGIATGQTMPTRKIDFEWFSFTPSDDGDTGGMKTFTVANFLTLHACISEHVDVEMNGEAVTPAVFSHGDVFRVREDGVPDFWFEDKASIYDESELDQHEHTYTYNGKVYDLTVYGGLLGPAVMGYLHPVKGVGGADLGDLDATLDAILALQAELIGGDA